MTCVAGIETKDGVWIGGDALSASVTEGLQTMRSTRAAKVFRRGAYLLGTCGSFRAADLLRYAVELPAPPAVGDPREHLVLKVIPGMRSVLTKEGGLVPNDEDGLVGPALLLAVVGQLFVVDIDFHVAPVSEGYAAVGSAAAVAYGALHATRNRPPKARIRAAIAAAEAHATGIRGRCPVLHQPRR